MSERKPKFSKAFKVLSATIGTLGALVTVLAFVLNNYDEWFEAGDKQLLRVAQELRYNRNFLENMIVNGRKDGNAPIKTLKTDALVALATERYDLLTKHAYGEQKYIYQHVLRYEDLAKRLNMAENREALMEKLLNMRCTLHDLYFLNQFLTFYTKPILEENLSEKQKYALGWNFLPRDEFILPNSEKKNMICFTVNGGPPENFIDYLSIIE